MTAAFSNMADTIAEYDTALLATPASGAEIASAELLSFPANPFNTHQYL